MSIYGTLKEIDIKLAKKQSTMVDTILEKAPVLAIVPFWAASHPMWNVYEETQDVSGPAFVNMNAPLPLVDMTTDIKKVDLDIMGGKIYVPEDHAKIMGGKEGYFAKKMPKILAKAGMDTEKRIYYDNLIRYAVANETAVSAGGTGNNTASIVAVRFEREVTGGIYSPEGWNSGTMLNVQPLYGGQLLTIPDGKYAGVEGYGMRLKGYFGMQIADPRTVGAILNITESNIPTDTQIDDLLADIRADKRDTYLLMHRKTQNRLHRFKKDALDMSVSERNYSVSFDNWDGIPIMNSYNILPFGETATVLN